MRTTTKRRARQLVLVTLAAPVAAWALEQAAHRAEAHDQASPAGRRLRQGADFMQRLVAGRWPTGSGSGRTPLSPGDSDRHSPTSIVVSNGHGPQRRFTSSAAAAPQGTRPRHPRRSRRRHP
jgi:hypothetical protein